jgi:hypothetical protein
MAAGRVRDIILFVWLFTKMARLRRWGIGHRKENLKLLGDAIGIELFLKVWKN